MQFAKEDLSTREMWKISQFMNSQACVYFKIKINFVSTDLAEEISTQSKFFLSIDKLYLSYIEIYLALDQG